MEPNNQPYGQRPTGRPAPKAETNGYQRIAFDDVPAPERRQPTREQMAARRRAKQKRAQRRRVALCVFVVFLVAVVVGAVVLVKNFWPTDRIPDQETLRVEDPIDQALQFGIDYKIVSFATSFGAADANTVANGPEPMDAASTDAVLQNTGSALDLLYEQNADFYLLQDVDVSAQRSFYFDQRTSFVECFPGFSSVFAYTYRPAKLRIPFLAGGDKKESGLLTLSSFSVSSAKRHSLPANAEQVKKQQQQDYAFSVSRVAVEGGKELVLINTQFAPFAGDNDLLSQQFAALCTVLSEEYANGNYVIAGGDFGMVLYFTPDYFPTTQSVPSWAVALPENALPEHFAVAYSKNSDFVPSRRSMETAYHAEESYVTTTDGFLVSDNITCYARNIDTAFLCSAHNPVTLNFELH